jgi:hypothetical protein
MPVKGRWGAVWIPLLLSCLVCGCGGELSPEVPPDPAFDQAPLSLAHAFFDAGYELVSYRELDADSDGALEALAVLTVKTLAQESFVGGSGVLLFGQQEGVWIRADEWKLDGVNASAELRDLTGDGFPELLVVTEKADRQQGDFVAPLRYTDHLSVFTYTPDLYLVELGAFSSSLAGVMRPQSTAEEWADGAAIRTVSDLPPAGSPLWQPVRAEIFAWDGREFVSVQVEERRRISPVVSWVVRRNAPWAAASLALGGVLSVVTVVSTRRLRLRERWVALGFALLLVVGGIGLGLAMEWLCVPGLVLVGLVGLEGGRRMAAWLVARRSGG